MGCDEYDHAVWPATEEHRGTGIGKRCKHHSDEAIAGFHKQREAHAAELRSARKGRDKFDPPQLEVGVVGTKACNTDRYPFCVTSVSRGGWEICISGHEDEPLTWRMYSNQYVPKSKTLAYQRSCRVSYSFGEAVHYLDPSF